MFLITLSFLLTTPGVWQPSLGFPALSPSPGQFLSKDLVLLGAAIWTAGGGPESRKDVRLGGKKRPSTRPRELKPKCSPLKREGT